MEGLWTVLEEELAAWLEQEVAMQAGRTGPAVGLHHLQAGLPIIIREKQSQHENGVLSQPDIDGLLDSEH